MKNLVHKAAIEEIKNAVDRIVIQHPEGEAFFDALDEYIKHIATETVYESLFAKFDEPVIILSGGFGKCVADRIDAGTLPKRQYILFEGGIRKGNTPIVMRDHFSLGHQVSKAVFIDDTIYGGITFKTIQEFLHSKYQWSSHIMLSRAVVVYDGRPEKREDVDSVFRYYDFYTATPNYDFSKPISN